MSKIKWLLGAVCAVAVGGCALPGYDTGSFNSSNHWYDFGAGKDATYEQKLAQEQEVDYEPVVVKITPSLIAHQKAESEQTTLSPNVRSLTGSEQTNNYVVGKGDVLQVIVFGHPELTNPGGTDSNNGGGSDVRGQLVDADGDIYYPYVGKLHAAGKTLDQIRSSITQGLSSYIREPQVDIRVRDYRSQRVYISGDIDKPCTVPVTDIELNIIQALDACSSLGSKEGGGVGVQNVRLIRDGESTLVNLDKLYATGHEIPLRPGDRLLIDDTANRVFMVGEFDQQEALPYATGGLSLSDAIADAGGLNQKTADASHIYVIRGFVGGKDFEDGGVKTVMRPKVYELDQSNPSGLLLANQFQLQPRDVVFAAPASFVNFNRALSLVLPSLDLLTRSFYLYDRVN